MRRLRAAWMRLTGLFGRPSRERELAAELEAHVQMHADDNIRAGMNPAQARRQAVLQLGGLEATKQAYRERGTFPLLENTLQDLRFALRQLRKNPGFTCTAILMLALGMGASVAIFAFVDAALVKPLPYQNPTRLVEATESIALFGRANLSHPDYLDWKKMNTVFSSFDVYTGSGYLLSTPSGAEPVPALKVSDGFFRTLGVKPILGRDFFAGESQPTSARTVILSYATWQRRFGAKNEVIGQTVSLGGNPFVIIGVLPKDFHFAPRGNAEFWVADHADDSCAKRRSCHNLVGVARLKDGISVAAAQAEMKAIAKQLELQYPGDNRGQGASVIPLWEAFIGNLRPILLMLLGGAGLLLLIACVNVASLLLVRSENRGREIAVRGALGASPARLVRQFITEGLALVLAGSVVGLAAAYGTMRLLISLLSEGQINSMPFLRGIGITSHVLIFAACVALFAAVLFSLTPLVRLRLHAVQEGLAEGSRGSAGTLWRRFGANLVVVELAMAVVLLVGAGLLGKSLYRLMQVDIGFQPDHLAKLNVSLPEVGYEKDDKVEAFGAEVVARISALPGVKAASIINIIPVSFNGNTDWIRFVGKPYHGEHNEVNQRDVSPEYFSTIQARLLQGRYFTNDDNATHPLAVIINQSLAKRYFPGEDPVGKQIGDDDLSPKSIKEIVGVVADVRDGALDQAIMPAVYYPFAQDPDTYFSLVVRTSQDGQSLLPLLGATVHQVDPRAGTEGEGTMEDHISSSANLHRSTAWLVGGFAALALLLSIVGLYGVIAYSVSQRTREIGVRMALGAQRSSVYQLILKEAGWLTATGIGLGIVSAIGAATLVSNLLFGIRAWDLPTLAGAASLLGVAALAASYLPARRAASVNPVEALRIE
jgi:macrolide transport system ATP-binding/permease protein